MASVSMSSQFLRVLMAVLTFSLLSACKVPDDPEGTTEKVMDNVLRVGALIEPLDQADAAAVTRVANVFRATPEFVTGDPHTLFAQLEDGEIHLVVGRIPANTPFTSDIALSDPLGSIMLGDHTDDRVLAVRKGENRFLISVNRAIEGLVE
ncbi:enoyl-CoA hydratase [Pelagivirga sediminicola]|nr:enoyl-CoA hydratase [Pelagivirga sediminicola]